MEPTYRDYETRRDAATVLLGIGFLLLAAGGLLFFMGVFQKTDPLTPRDPLARLINGIFAWMYFGIGPITSVIGAPCLMAGSAYARAAQDIRAKLHR